MNQTHQGGMARAQSAFRFIEDQVAAYNQVQLNNQKQIRRTAKRLCTVLTAITLVTAVNLPQLKTQAQEFIVEPVAEVAIDSSIHFDSSNYSLLTIEQIKPEIKLGKSLVTLEQERIVKAKLVASTTGEQSAKRVSQSLPTDVAHKMAQDAAARAGIGQHWKILASVWTKETGKSGDSCIISKADGRAQGPMQFMPSTFRAHAKPGANICKATDALDAAADLLKESGLDEGDVKRALYSYNHSIAYVNSVEKIAQSIQ